MPVLHPEAIQQVPQQAGGCVLGVPSARASDACMCRLVQHLAKRHLDLQARRTLLECEPAPAGDILGKVCHLPRPWRTLEALEEAEINLLMMTPLLIDMDDAWDQHVCGTEVGGLGQAAPVPERLGAGS